MKMNSTKSKLMASLLVLVLCVTAFFGSTYAWFTDSVTSSGNKIQAGTLDIELYMHDGTQYKDISGDTAPIFGAEDSLTAKNDNADTLWEPGKTQVAYFKLKNAGSLDLKYLVNVKAQNPENGKDLYKVMKYQVIENAKPEPGLEVTAWDASNANSVIVGTQPGTKGDVTMGAGAEHFFALSIHMDENAGNEYQGGQVIFDIEVLATQKNAELDSFGPDYDEMAEYINGAYVAPAVNKQITGEANAAFTEKINEVLTVSGTHGTGTVDVEFVPSVAHTDTVIAANEAVLSYNIEVTGQKDGTPVTVSIFVGKGLSDVTVYHDGDEMNAADYSYNSATGILDITTTTFSIFDITFDAPNVVTTKEGAQEALDAAKSGDVIRLVSGVDYGTLYIRKNADSVVVDITDIGGDATGNEKFRKIEGLTIIGAPGATVDNIAFETGWIAGSGASYIAIDNLTIMNVTFSGKTTPVNIDGSSGGSLGIDGLKLENCKMKDADGKDRLVFQQISGYEDLIDKTTGAYVMTTGIRNMTITGCEVEGAYMVTETRAMENITITNNTFKGIKQRDMLITSDTTNHSDKTYAGTITITGNTSIGGEERFIRGSLNNGDVKVVIENNTITNYLGADTDYIKVTEVAAGNVTTSNNKITVGVDTADRFVEFINKGYDLVLNKDITVDADSTITVPAGNAVVLDLNGHTISGTADGTGNREMFLVKGDLTVENGSIKMSATQNQGWNAMTTVFDVTEGGVLNIENALIENLGGTDMNFAVHLNNWGEVTLNVEKSTLKAPYIAVRVFNSGPNANNVTINNSTLEGKYSFWVHNYVSADFEDKLYSGASAAYDVAKVKERLVFDIFNGTNKFVYDETKTGPVLYGFNDSIYLDAGGNTIVTSGEELQDAVNNGDSNIVLGGDIDLSQGLVIPGL